METLRIGPKTFTWGARTYLMGILNITPDSFSGDGLYDQTSLTVRRALDQARRFVESGAEILDVGGESTRPGAHGVSADEELERVIPVIRGLAKEFPETVISIDTYKASVALEALQVGAHMVNDVWALHADPDMGALVAGKRVPIILMHNRSKPSNAQIQERLGGRYVDMDYKDLLEDIKRDLQRSIDLAHQAGILHENIILDPGIGFGKTVQQNLKLLNRLDEIKAMNYPILVGTSRKSFIGYTLDLPPDQRLEGTAATVAIAIARGADIVRVHDVEVMARVVKMTDAITRQV